MTRIGTAWSRALDVVFPARCIACKRFGSFFCPDCASETPRPEAGRCARCFQRGKTDSCLSCYTHPPGYRALRSTFLYTDAARAAVLAFKFGGVSAAAGDMAAPMFRLLEEWAPPVDVVVPVPLGGMRQRTRGYNQAALLANELAKLADLPLARKALRRITNTPPQTQQVDAIARRGNVRGAFGPDNEAPSGSVLLVDDVTTTGATLDACARALTDSGAAEVYCLTFARED